MVEPLRESFKKYEGLADHLGYHFKEERVIDAAFKQEIRGWPSGDFQDKIDNLLDELIRGGDAQTYAILKEALGYSRYYNHLLRYIIQWEETVVKISSSASC